MSPVNPEISDLESRKIVHYFETEPKMVSITLAVYRLAQRLVFIGGIERCSRLLGRIVRIGQLPKHVEVHTACRGQISTTKEDHHVSVVLIFDDQAAKMANALTCGILARSFQC
jgi:hypothetical protein